MEIIYNCFAGISGDMNLAAMIDLGMNPHILKAELSKLGLDNEFNLDVYPAVKSGISGTQVNVKIKHQQHNHHHHGEADHNLHLHHEEKIAHHHEHHHHEHDHSQQRNYSAIEQLITTSSLDKKIKEIAIKIFWEVAIAEGKVHNKAPEEVHFHEVGATDSIVDIVGAAICYHHLGITHVTSTMPELGGGFVTCQHGKMPVPAPATIEILQGIKCSTGAVQKEMTTPTGAAILKVLTNQWVSSPDVTVIKTAYGIGHRDVEIPNVLRVYACQPKTELHHKTSVMIECNVDDMSAEDLALVPELLLKAGAKDAFLMPIIMKKGRAATQLSVLCEEEQFTSLCDLILLNTTSIGLRSYPVDKLELPRINNEMNTPWGMIRYKESTLPNGEIRQKIEFEDIKQIAEKESCSMNTARERLNALLTKKCK